MFFFVAFDLFVAFVVAAGAQAKPTAPPRAPSAPRFDVSIGVGILSGNSLDGANADLRGRTGGPLALFTTSSRLAGSVPIEARWTFLLNPRYSLEFRAGWARPELQTEIDGDFEGAPPQTVAERFDLYTLDVGLLVAFRETRLRTMVPFISGGAGYAATVHEGLTLLENGVVYRGGGGFKYPLSVRTQGRVKGVGIRGDAGLAFMTGGVAAGSGATRQGSASGSLYLAF